MANAINAFTYIYNFFMIEENIKFLMVIILYLNFWCSRILKPCSQNMTIINRKFYEVKIETFGWFHVNLNANKQRTYARMCSNWNLVMPFSLNRIYYMIPRYWVVGGARGGPLYLKKGTFFLMSLNQSIPVFNKKSPFTASEMTFYIFV